MLSLKEIKHAQKINTIRCFNLQCLTLSENLMRCDLCNNAYYCSSDCQTKHKKKVNNIDIYIIIIHIIIIIVIINNNSIKHYVFRKEDYQEKMILLDIRRCITNGSFQGLIS